MSKRQRIHRSGLHFSSHYRETHPETGELERITLIEMANRAIADDADGVLEAFHGKTVKGRPQDLYAFVMIAPRNCGELMEAFCAGVAGLIEKGILPAGDGLAPFLPGDFAPTSNTGLPDQRAQHTAGEVGQPDTGRSVRWESQNLD